MGKLVLVGLCALGALGGILIPPAAGASRFSTSPKFVDDLAAVATKPICAVTEGDNEPPDDEVEGNQLLTATDWSQSLEVGPWLRVSIISPWESLPAIPHAMLAKGLQGQ